MIEDGFLGGIKFSESNSVLESSSLSLLSGTSISIRLVMKDQNANVYRLAGSSPVIAFSHEGGHSTGYFSTPKDNLDGSFSTVFTGVTSGTATKIQASVDGKMISSSLMIQVLPSNFSLSHSYVTTSSSTVGSGSSVTVTLHSQDDSNNPLSSGGLAVSFNYSGGTSTGNFSAVTDHGDGTYSASFTGIVAGSATNIGATIATMPLTSTKPSVSVTHGAASQILFKTQPVGGVAEGLALATQPVIQIKDASNNLVTTGPDSTANVTLSLTSGVGSLGGTLSVAASAGEASFSGISVSTQGSGKVITATKVDTTGSGGTMGRTVASNTFTINPPAPGAFTITSAVAGPSQVVLSWGASLNAASFSVRYGTSSGSYPTTVSTNASSPLTISSLNPGSTYYFMVTATNVTGTTAASTEASATALGTFSISSTTVTTPDTVRLTWGNATGATNYIVKYGTASGSYGTTFSSNATSPLDITGLTGGSTYYFMVTAENASGSVNASAESSAQALGSFTISSVIPALGSASLAWGSLTGATSYDILWDTASRTGTGVYASSSTNLTSGASISGLSAGTTYYFRLRANGANGSVLSTNEVSSAVYQNFTLDIPFTSGTASSYTISDSTKIDLSTSLARLNPADQTDDINSTGASSGGFLDGTTTGGTQWDSTNHLLKLNTTTNLAELDASWAPQWSNIVAYWKFNGSGSIANGATISAVKGPSGSAINANGLGFTYTTGNFNQAINLDGSGGDSVNLGSGTDLDITNISISTWVNRQTSTQTYPGVLHNESYSGAKGFVLADVYGTTTDDPLCFRLNGSAGESYKTCEASATLDQWVHYAATFDGTTIKLYKNSHLVAKSTPNFSAIVLNSGAIKYIGYNNYKGSIDEMAVWNSALTASEISDIYKRQSAKFSGLYLSRVMNAFSAQSWTTMSVQTTIPFYKELPGNVAESTTAYPSLVTSDTLNNKLYGYWKLNETSGSTFADSSGKSNTGTGVGTLFNTACSSTTTLSTSCYGGNGKIGQAVSLNNNYSNYINIATPTTELNTVQLDDSTYSVWYYPRSIPTNVDGTTFNDSMQGILIKQGFHYGIHYNSLKKFVFYTYNTSNASKVAATSGVFPPDQWYHVVAIMDKTNGYLYIYVNGKLEGTNNVGANYTVRDYGTTTWKIGLAKPSSGYAYPAHGLIDEVAIWGRALSSAEVLQLYRRGGNRIKHQIRTCTASNCSDQEALTDKGWKGPDNTGTTYFSELYNSLNNALLGSSLSSSPTMTFSNFSSTGLAVASRQYVQYRSILESDDTNSLCSGSTCSPEIKSVAIGPTHYATSIPTIISKASIGSAYETLDPNGLTQTLGAGNCSSGAKYALSSDGSNFYFWDTNAWALSSDYSTASDAATIRANLDSFPSSPAGTGVLQVKTFLNSSGTSPCEVDNLRFTGKKF